MVSKLPFRGFRGSAVVEKLAGSTVTLQYLRAVFSKPVNRRRIVEAQNSRSIPGVIVMSKILKKPSVLTKEKLLTAASERAMAP